MSDEDPDVVDRVRIALEGDIIRSEKCKASPALARALVKAYEKAQPGVTRKYGYGRDNKERLAETISLYEAHLQKRRESAAPQERDQIDSVIQIIKQSQWGKEKHD